MSNLAQHDSTPHPDGQPVGARLEAASAPRPVDQHLPLASAPPLMASQGAGDGQSSFGNFTYLLPLAPAGAATLPSSAPPLGLSFPPPAAPQPLAAGPLAPAGAAAYHYGGAAAYPMPMPLAAAPPSASSSALGESALSYPLPLPAQGAQASATQNAQPASTAAAPRLSGAPPAGHVEVPKVDANGDHGMHDLPQLPTPPPPRLDASGAAYMPFAPVASGSGSTAAAPAAADGQQPSPGAVDAHGHPVALPAGPPPRPPPPPLKNKVGAPTITALTGHVPIPSHLPKPRGRKIPKVRSAVKAEDGAAAEGETAGKAAPAVKPPPLTAAQRKKKKKEAEEERKRRASRGGWGAVKGKQGTRPETFLRKMWKLLNHDPEDVTPYMRWDKTGRLIMIPDEKALVENVCKVHFSQQNITSFNKQMNNWDFKRHSRSQRDLEIISRTEPGVNRQTRIWYHTQLHARSTWSDVQNVGRHEDGMAKKRKAQEDAEVNGPRKRGRKPKRKAEDELADDQDEAAGDDDAPEGETSEAAATRISASLRSKARDPTTRPSYKLYDSDDESLSGSSDDELGSDDYKEDGGRGGRRASDSDELDALTDSDEEGKAGGPSARAGEAAAHAPDGAALENDQLEVGADGDGDAEMVDAQRIATKGKTRASSTTAAAKGKGKARAASPARASDETPMAAAEQEQTSSSSAALPGPTSPAEVVEAVKGGAGTGATAASAEEAAAQGAAVAAARDEKEAAKQERENAAAAAPEPASVAPAAGSSAADSPSPALEPRTSRTTRGAPSPFTRGKDAAAAAAHPTTGRPSRAAAAKAAAALNTGADSGSSRGDRAARRDMREPEQPASGAEQDKEGGPSQAHGMFRGGAGFGAGAGTNGSSHEEDSAAAQAMALQPSASNGGTTQAHVYSLPRPPHLGTAASALADASAVMDGSTSTSVEARSASAASHDSHVSSHFIYPDASNPYGSSPYPAYPHQAQTPVTVHHHPTRPLPGPYHSEPGLARTAFYYHGASPIPRPFIHPGHGITDELLDSADAAGVYGDDFAMQNGALEGRF